MAKQLIDNMTDSVCYLTSLCAANLILSFLSCCSVSTSFAVRYAPTTGKPTHYIVTHNVSIFAQNTARQLLASLKQKSHRAETTMEQAKQQNRQTLTNE